MFPNFMVRLCDKNNNDIILYQQTFNLLYKVLGLDLESFPMTFAMLPEH